MRRKPRAEASGLMFEPLPKRKRASNHACGSDQASTLDTTSVQRHTTLLQKEWSKTKRNRGSIRSLMSELGPHRRSFIEGDRPAVKDVLTLYPPLTEYVYVSLQYSCTKT